MLCLVFFRKNPDLYGALAKGQSPKVGWPLFNFLLWSVTVWHFCPLFLTSKGIWLYLFLYYFIIPDPSFCVKITFHFNTILLLWSNIILAYGQSGLLSWFQLILVFAFCKALGWLSRWPCHKTHAFMINNWIWAPKQRTPELSGYWLINSMGMRVAIC